MRACSLKTYLLMLSFLIATLLSFGPATPPTPAAVPARAATTASLEPCRIYGSVYLETDPGRRGYCFVSVYLEPEEAFADLLVFNEQNKLFADKAGLWHEAPSRNFADYVLFVSPNRGTADFAIHYTKVRSFAGCKN